MARVRNTFYSVIRRNRYIFLQASKYWKKENVKIIKISQANAYYKLTKMKRKQSDQDENCPLQAKQQKAEGLERAGPGIDYQVQLLMFFAHQGHTLSQNVKDFTFEIGRERKEAGKFDDIVVRYKVEQHKQWNYLLIQAKYTSEIISIGKLLSSSSTEPFTLLKYFSSYIEVKQNLKTDIIESCVIATNTDFNYDNYDTVQPLRLKCTKARAGSGIKGTEFYLVDVKQDNGVNRIFKTEEMKEAKYFKFEKRPLLLNELQKEFNQKYCELIKKGKQKDTDKDIIRNLQKIMLSGQSFTDELEEFLDKLLFIVKLPNRKDLRSITKRKIGEEMSFLDDSIVDQFNRMMFDYTITLRRDFLDRVEIEKFFLKMKQLIDNIMCRPSFYLKIQNSKIDFTSREIVVPNFLLRSKKQILILKTDSMFLSAVKVDRILKDLSTTLKYSHYSYKNKYTFINLEELVDNEKLLQEITRSFSCEDQNNLCIIILDSELSEKAKNILFILYSILCKNAVKKIILLMNDSEPDTELEWVVPTELDNLKQVMVDGFHFNNLTETSKKGLLETYVTFQGKHIKLKRLYFRLEDDEDPSLEQMNHLTFDAKTLESIMENGLYVKKPSSVSTLEGAYHTFYEEIDRNNLSATLGNITPDEEKYFFISGIYELCEKNASRLPLQDITDRSSIEKDESYINWLKMFSKKNKRITLTGSDCAERVYFEKLCHENPDKVFYWIDYKNSKFILRNLYYPRFLERHFTYPEKVIIQHDFKVKICECDDETYVITGVKTVEQLSAVLQLNDSKERETLVEKYELKKIMIQAEMNESESCNLKQSRKPVHWLRVDETNKNIIWEKSDGSMGALRNYCKVEKTELSEKKLIEKMKNKSSIIVEKPGMGKSTTLNALSEKMLQSHWVIFVTLKYWQSIIDNLPENIDQHVVVKFLSATKNISTRIEKNLLKYTLDKNNDIGVKPLLFLFDGFDEIRSYDHRNVGKDKFEKLLKFLKDETLCTVWISAREHDTDRLQDALSTFHIQFKPLENNQQREYFLRNWNTSLITTVSRNELDQTFSDGNSKFNIYFKKLSSVADKILADKNNTFMGIPLTLRLFAESFRDKFIKYLKTDENFENDFNHLSLLKLYRDFIDGKFKIFLNEKTNLCNGFTGISEGWIKKTIGKLHSRLAFKEVFGGETFKRLLGLKSPFEDENLNVNLEQLHALLSLGIIRSTGHEHFEFLHRTFAEYFVSELFVNVLLNKHPNNETKYRKVVGFLKLEILKQSNWVIYNFLDARSKEDEKLKRIWDVIISGEDEHANLLDEATNKHIFRGGVNGELKSKKLTRHLREAVDSFVQWNSDGKSFQYFGDRDYVGTLRELLDESLLETDTYELQLTLHFLITLYKASEFNIFNQTLSAAKLEAILSHYITQASEHAQCDMQLIRNYVDKIFLISDEDFEKYLNGILNCNFRKSFVKDCNIMSEYHFDSFLRCLQDIKNYCIPDLALEVVNTYIIQLSKSRDMKSVIIETQNILNKVLPWLMTAHHYFSKYNMISKLNIDAFSVVKVFASMMDCKEIEGVVLSKTSLQGLLKCIKDVTHLNHISEESFRYSINALISLKHWNFRLIYDYITGLTLHHDNINFSIPLELDYELKIVNLLKLRNRCLVSEFGPECAEVVKSILAKN